MDDHPSLKGLTLHVFYLLLKFELIFSQVDLYLMFYEYSKQQTLRFCAKNGTVLYMGMILMWTILTVQQHIILLRNTVFKIYTVNFPKFRKNFERNYKKLSRKVYFGIALIFYNIDLSDTHELWSYRCIIYLIHTNYTSVDVLYIQYTRTI